MAGAGMAIASIVQAIMQAQAMQQQLQIERENLAFQKQNAAQQYRLATAGRTDAYGNKQRFDDLLNEWLTELTPTQESIMRAGEREQRLSLTEDAGRQRNVRRRQAVRARGAAEDYNTARMAPEAPREGAVRDQLVQLMANARNAQSGDAMGSLARSSLRLGTGTGFARLRQEAMQDNASGDATDMLNARSAALQEYMGRRQATEGERSSKMAQAGQTMDAVGDMPLRFGTAPQELTGQQGNQIASIMAALQGGAGQVGAAMSRLGQAAGRTVDLSGIGGGIDGLVEMLLKRNQNNNPNQNLRPIRYNPGKGEVIWMPPGLGGDSNDDDWLNNNDEDVF